MKRSEVSPSETKCSDVDRFIMFLDTLPDIDEYRYVDDGKSCVTQEWLCGSFAGRSFCADTYEEAVAEMFDYLNRHVGHDSIVGREVTRSGWPDLERVWAYIEPYYRNRG